MPITIPKGYIPLGETITRLGQNLSDEWTGEEFAPEFATMAKINQDTQDYFIGWVAARCINVENTSIHPNRRTKENPDGGQPLSTSGTERWDRASGIYEEARSLIDEIAQFESIRNGGGHLAKIWNDPEREIVSEWPENFPLSKDDLEALKVEEEEFRAPREAAYKRLDEAVRLLQQELCGTPPDCEDAIPALRHYPDRSPDRIDPASWIGLAGLERLKCAARADYQIPGSSGVIISSEHIERLCAPPEPSEEKPQKRAGGRPAKWDWDGAVAHLLTVANSLDGLPSQQSEIERLVAEWFMANYDEQPVESTIRERVQRYCHDVLKEAGN